MSEIFVVFQDTLNGLREIPQLPGSTLAETVQNITEGGVGHLPPSQNDMYFIYKLYDKMSMFGTRFDVYQYSKAVAGTRVDPHLARNKGGLRYALTPQTSMEWLFADHL